MPRALVYDSAGDPQVVPPGSEAQAALIATAERIVEIALEEEPPAE